MRPGTANSGPDHCKFHVPSPCRGRGGGCGAPRPSAHRTDAGLIVPYREHIHRAGLWCQFARFVKEPGIRLDAISGPGV